MKKILVVDDHDAIRSGIKLVLEGMGKADGYEVTEAANGQAALAVVSTNQPDLAIVDLMMPEMDGFALCEQLKQRYPQLPVIILTAKADPQTATKVQTLYKPDRFLTKPIDNKALFETVKEVLNAVK